MYKILQKIGFSLTGKQASEYIYEWRRFGPRQLCGKQGYEQSWKIYLGVVQELLRNNDDFRKDFVQSTSRGIDLALRGKALGAKSKDVRDTVNTVIAQGVKPFVQVIVDLQKEMDVQREHLLNSPSGKEALSDPESQKADSLITSLVMETEDKQQKQKQLQLWNDCKVLYGELWNKCRAVPEAQQLIARYQSIFLSLAYTLEDKESLKGDPQPKTAIFSVKTLSDQ